MVVEVNGVQLNYKMAGSGELATTYVVSAFRRTHDGPAKAGHYVLQICRNRSRP